MPDRCRLCFDLPAQPRGRDALRQNLKGIVVEKPLGDTAASGRRILEMVQAKGIPMGVPHGLLVRRHAREIIDRVHAGEIGDLKLVEIQCRGWDIINAGIHWLNFFVVLTQGDPPVEVSRSLTSRPAPIATACRSKPSRSPADRQRAASGSCSTPVIR